MFSRRIQQRARQLVMYIVQPLARSGVTPNMLTGIGLVLSILTAVVIAQGSLVLGGWLVLLAGIFDMFDGAMARVQNAATTFGAFLDSTIDRYSESIILLGLLIYALQHPNVHDVVWPAPFEQGWMVTLIFVSVVGSLMVSYTKARAEGLGIECKVGLLARPERVILLALGLITGTGIWALALLAVLSNVTAIERMLAVWLSVRRSAHAQVAQSSRQQSHEQHDTSKPEQRHSIPYTTLNTGTDKNVQSNPRPLPSSVSPLNEGIKHE